MQQITNGQRPATKQRDTDIIISRQTQTNIRNLKISNPKQQTEQRQIWTINTTQQKTNAKQRENQKQTQANPQITNNNQNSPENYKINPFRRSKQS